MRRVSSKWISVLGAACALLFVAAALPACDHGESSEDDVPTNTTLN